VILQELQGVHEISVRSSRADARQRSGESRWTSADGRVAREMLWRSEDCDFASSRRICRYLLSINGMNVVNEEERERERGNVINLKTQFNFSSALSFPLSFVSLLNFESRDNSSEKFPAFFLQNPPIYPIYT